MGITVRLTEEMWDGFEISSKLCLRGVEQVAQRNFRIRGFLRAYGSNVWYCEYNADYVRLFPITRQYDKEFTEFLKANYPEELL